MTAFLFVANFFQRFFSYPLNRSISLKSILANLFCGFFNRSSSSRGQYMVEFALAFVIFVIFVFLVIDLGFLIYNHNLYHFAVVEGARVGSLGGSNQAIMEKINQQIDQRTLPGILFLSRPGDVEIFPAAEIERVDGMDVKINLELFYGLGIFGFMQLIELPVSTQRLIIQYNDLDNDGCKDQLSGPGVPCNSYQEFSSTNPRDHRNTGVTDSYLFGGSQEDADGDGVSWEADTIAIGYTDGSTGSCPAGYYLYRPHDQPLGSTCEFGGISGWDQGIISDGWYHAPEIWDDGSEAPQQMFPRRLPRWGVDNSSRPYIIRQLRTAHDTVNNGWLNKYDRYPQDPERW